MVRLVVMAAGLASRMGKDKLELPWKGSTILGSVLETVLAAIEGLPQGIFPLGVELVVVARKPMECYLTASLDRRFCAAGGSWFHDPAPRPLAETIKLGLKGVSDETLGIAFLPGDQVGLEPEILSSLMIEFVVNKPEFLLPVAEGVTGSPVFFHSKYLPDLLELQGEQGGRQILTGFRERWSFFQVTPGFFKDIDTPVEYLNLQNH